MYSLKELVLLVSHAEGGWNLWWESVPQHDDYEVEFPNGDVKEYAANIIAENMLTQVDSDGYYSLTMMKAIIDYKKDNAVAVPKSH
jgi:hypothetical protein